MHNFRYLNGSHYLEERYGYRDNRPKLDEIMDQWFNLIISFIFPAAAAVVNLVLFLVPLPGFVKAKFRE